MNKQVQKCNHIEGMIFKNNAIQSCLLFKSRFYYILNTSKSVSLCVNYLLSLVLFITSFVRMEDQMQPPSYEEASLQPHNHVLPPPSYDTSLNSPTSPPPSYLESGKFENKSSVSLFWPSVQKGSVFLTLKPSFLKTVYRMDKYDVENWALQKQRQQTRAWTMCQ